jgi:hypothetical protein
MNHNKLEQLLYTVQSKFGYLVSLEFKWDKSGSEYVFNLYFVLESDRGDQYHIIFFDVNRLKIIQPVASGILFEMNVTPEADQGPFQQKKYYHVFDTDENWIDFYCVDFEFDITDKQN